MSLEAVSSDHADTSYINSASLSFFLLPFLFWNSEKVSLFFFSSVLFPDLLVPCLFFFLFTLFCSFPFLFSFFLICFFFSVRPSIFCFLFWSLLHYFFFLSFSIFIFLNHPFCPLTYFLMSLYCCFLAVNSAGRKQYNFMVKLLQKNHLFLKSFSELENLNILSPFFILKGFTYKYFTYVRILFLSIRGLNLKSTSLFYFKMATFLLAEPDLFEIMQ